MILSSYILEQLAIAHERDLLEAARRSRLAAEARRRPSAQHHLRPVTSRRGHRPPVATASRP